MGKNRRMVVEGVASAVNFERTVRDFDMRNVNHPDLSQPREAATGEMKVSSGIR